MSEPLDGIKVELRVIAPYGWRKKFTVTPIDDNQEVFEYTVRKFSKEIWKDLKYIEKELATPKNGGQDNEQARR